MSKVAKWIFPAAGGKDGIIGTATAVVGFMTGNWGMVASGVAKVAGAGKKSQAQARQASILQLSLGETPREAVLGMTATGGSLVDVFNFGGQYGTDKVTRCVALADHAIDGIEGFYVNDVYYPWTNEGQQAVFSNKLSFHFRNATADGYDPPQHVQQNGGWGVADRMAGITHIWIDWYVDEKVWPQGHPDIRFLLRGLRVYDARFDPALGYTGPDPQVWEDRSTHRFSRNAKVLRYAYTRGIFAEGHHGDPDYLLIGRGLTAEEAPPELVIADANLCDEIVDGVARYAVDAVISASQPYIEVDGLFAAAMAGEVIQRQGTVEVEAGQAKAVVVTITDDDLVAGEPIRFSDFLPDNDGGRVNTVIGRYVEPALGYRDHSAPVRRSLSDIQADGGPREQTISLPFVTQVKQVDRIIEIRRLMSRLERRASIVLPPKFAGLEEGDWIAWQSQRRHGGATRRYRIETYRQPETWRMYLTLREIASSVFGVPDPVEDTTTPPPPPQVIDALALTGVAAEAITLPGDSSILPAIRFRWDAPVDAALLAIRAEVRRLGESESAPTRTEEVNAGVMIATNGVGPDQQLQARLVPIGDPSRPVLASAWVTVSTSGLVAGDVSPTAPGLSQIRSDIEAAFGDIFNIDGLLTQARTDIDAQGVEIAAARGGQPSLNSRIVQVNQARIDGDTSNAQAIALVQARTANTEADIIDLENALATETGARAQAIQQVNARLAVNQNLMPNGAGEEGVAGWTGPNAQPLVWPPYGGSLIKFALAGTLVDNYINAPRARIEGGQTVTLQWKAIVEGTFTGDLNAYIVWSKADGSYNGETGRTSVRAANPTITAIAPANTAYGRMGVHVNGNAGSGANLLLTNCKIENGSIATRYSSESALRELSASVTEWSLAIIDLENQQNIALWRIKAEASGSRPAIIEAYSGLGISALAFSAEQLYLGDNTVFDDATNTWQTIDGSTVYIRAEGAPFGAFSNLREWWGPTGIALGAMTPDNGYSGRMTTAPYNFTNTLNPRTFSAYASPGSIEAHRSTAGSLTSAAVSILYQNAKGAVSVTWARLIGGVTAAGSAVIDAPNELTTTFTKTVSAQERTDTVFQATLTDAGSGERRQVIVPVVFTSGAA